MHLNEARTTYQILYNHAGKIARKDEQEILDLLNLSDDKDTVIAAIKNRLNNVKAHDSWRRAKLLVALDELERE